MLGSMLAAPLLMLLQLAAPLCSLTLTLTPALLPLTRLPLSSLPLHPPVIILLKFPLLIPPSLFLLLPLTFLQSSIFTPLRATRSSSLLPSFFLLFLLLSGIPELFFQNSNIKGSLLLNVKYVSSLLFQHFIVLLQETHGYDELVDIYFRVVAKQFFLLFLHLLVGLSPLLKNLFF